MKIGRFGKTDFQEKLARARHFQRKPRIEPASSGAAFLQKLGFHSKFTRTLAGLLALIILYYLTLSQFFLVKKVLLASDSLNPKQIEDVLRRMSRTRLAKIVPSNHIVFLQKKSLLESLQKDLPQVRDIKSFKRIYPDQVALELEIREPIFVWQSGQDFFFLDQDAIVFQKILNYSPEVYAETVISDKIAEPVKVGEELSPKRPFEFIGEIMNLWPEKISQTNLESFAVPGLESQDVFVKTVMGFQVYFDIERGAGKQIDNLNLILGREIRPETYSGLSYIDLRLPTTAYYCYKDAPCAPEAQKQP